jgi:hypothetical protein
LRTVGLRRLVVFRADVLFRVLVFRAVVLRAAVFRVAVLRVAVFRVVVFFLVEAVLRPVAFLAVVDFRDEVPPERDDDVFEDDPDFVSPDSARCLLTVRAAISFARLVERPCFFSESLMCSY